MRNLWTKLRAAWSDRAQIANPMASAESRSFLPAVMALQETPPSPFGRVIVWTIIAAIVFALVWSVLGKVEIIAVAQGKIVGAERSKVIQPLETGTVEKILVQDGQSVEKGDVLVVIDPTSAEADITKIEEARMGAAITGARLEAFLASVDHGQLVQLTVPNSVPKQMAEVEQAQLALQVSEYQSAIAAQQTKISQRRAEYAANKKTIAKLRAMLPIVVQREKDALRLSKSGFISKHAVLERTQERIEYAQDLEFSRTKGWELSAAIKQAKRELETIVATAKRQAHAELSASIRTIEQLAQDEIKAVRREALKRLISPVNGTVQQLAVFTEGGVVTPAQVLMVVVPTDGNPEVEAILDNKDIGFVRAGQVAAVKIETFPFTKYGMIDGEVSFVSRDAVNDEVRGLVFPVRIKLLSSTIAVDQRTVRLSPGMRVTVEINNGERRIIDYLLSPIMSAVDESLNER